MNYTSSIRSLVTICIATGLMILAACDDQSNIGETLTEPNVSINIDSSFNIDGASFHQPDFDSRSETLLIGGVDMEGIGSYSSSIVTQLMAASSMPIPDSIALDSIQGMNLKLSFRKGALTGDSLAPCQLKVFQLTKQLPSGIQSSFDPTGYYNPSSVLGVKNYTASQLGTKDSTAAFTTIKVKMPLTLARQFVTKYRTDPGIFQWPQTFNNYFPGLYIENTFGKGCLVNMTVAEMTVYWKKPVLRAEVVNDTVKYVWRSKLDSVALLSTAPEVLSSNNIKMTIAPPIQQMVSQNKIIVMSPCGYLASIKIPAQQIIDRYYKSDFELAVINNLTLSIPAQSVPNNYGLKPAPNLLLVRRCDMTSFFAQNKIPDENKKSFYGSYSTATGKYNFTSMRQYIVDLLEKGGKVSEEDMDFVLIPVNITTEYNALSKVSIVTGCTPYIYKPTICELDLSKAVLKFIYGTKN